MYINKGVTSHPITYRIIKPLEALIIFAKLPNEPSPLLYYNLYSLLLIYFHVFANIKYYADMIKCGNICTPE